ncbi:MAG: hypothetical protein TR69_WS6001000888 [candidate division WS6 bacterium OLB20]|uniref:Uncharacterized protein n=1 Tax=candidate division WS6 bacterium OLB20 TaxID=1617426 RepID=A0A136LZ17_9BACT|nr:MAG: hypothetical protein TR69_WS6001000888 [candidate division WS6 bacterium OLB20]
MPKNSIKGQVFTLSNFDPNTFIFTHIGKETSLIPYYDEVQLIRRKADNWLKLQDLIALTGRHEVEVNEERVRNILDNDIDISPWLDKARRMSQKDFRLATSEFEALHRLLEMGHEFIEFIPEENGKTPDLKSECNGVTFYTEVKSSVEETAVSIRWLKDRIEDAQNQILKYRKRKKGDKGIIYISHWRPFTEDEDVYDYVSGQFRNNPLINKDVLYLVLVQGYVGMKRYDDVYVYDACEGYDPIC